MSGANYHVHYTTLLAVDVTGDKWTWTPGTPVEIVRWGYIAFVLIDVGTECIVKADKTNSAGTRGDGDLGSISTGSTDVAAQDGMYTENVSPGVTAHPTEHHKLIPGESITFQVTDAADTSGDAYFFIEYRKLPFVGDANSGDNGLANLTKVTS